MRYIAHNRQPRCRHHHAHRSRNHSFSSFLFDAICTSTEDVEQSVAYKKCGNREETRNVEAEDKTPMMNCNYKSVSRLERQWVKDHASWTNNEKLMRGRSAKIGLFNAEKYEAEDANSKSRSEFHLSLQSSTSSSPSRSSDYVSDSTTNFQYFSYDAESYRRSSSIPVAKAEKNSNDLGLEDRASKSWAVGGEWSRDFHGKSTVRDGGFGPTQTHFIPADHYAKIMSKSKSCKDSMKPKQPISPGRKLTNFLNTLFMGGGTRKKNISSSYTVSDSNSDHSAETKPSSSYSNSSSSYQSKPCLSKSSGGSKNTDGVKRCVTFYPTSVIVDENSRPCGEKYLHGAENLDPHPNPSNYRQITHPSTESYKLPLLSKKMNYRSLQEYSHTVAGTANNIIDKHPKANSIIEAALIRDLDKRDENEEDNDDGSCSSSDLFELESLDIIDMTVYESKLPV